MKNADQATQTKRNWSFTQEMHLAFTEWVNRLPFIKKDTPHSLEREDLEDESSDKVPEERDR